MKPRQQPTKPRWSRRMRRSATSRTAESLARMRSCVSPPPAYPTRDGRNWVPHPRRVLVFAPRVGDHECQCCRRCFCFFLVFHRLRRPTGDETVPHSSSVSCSMSGRPQRPTIGNSSSCFLSGHDFSRAESAHKMRVGFSPCVKDCGENASLNEFPTAASAPLHYSS